MPDDAIPLPTDRLLQDGQSVSQLIDRSRREVAQRVYSDPEIYQLERERIWARAWIVVGHESEIPNPGDFVTRRICDDPVIVSRTRQGDIACTLNVCPHRGAAVCRTDAGNASLFRCIYHGWVFNLDGSFRGAPYKEDMYPKGIDPEQASLRKARVEVFGGIIFANWSEDAPPLDEYLGSFRWYLNMMFNRTNRGLEVLGPPLRFVINANWKIAAEQFAGDAYHAGQLHRSLAELTGRDLNDPRQWAMYDTKVSTEEGHGVICFHQARRFALNHAGYEDLSPLEKLAQFPPPGMPREMVPELKDRFTEHELSVMADTPPSNGGVFPNVGLWSTTSITPEGHRTSFLSLRTYVPRGVDKFEFTMWVLVERGASEEFRDLMRRTASLSQGASGFVEQDDAEVWPGISSGAVGYVASHNPMKYWASSPHAPEPGWPGGGVVATEFSRDDSQWAWWSRYFDYLTAKD